MQFISGGVHDIKSNSYKLTHYAIFIYNCSGFTCHFTPTYYADVLVCDNRRTKLLPVTHVLVDTWMSTIKPVYKLLKVSGDLK